MGIGRRWRVAWRWRVRWSSRVGWRCSTSWRVGWSTGWRIGWLRSYRRTTITHNRPIQGCLNWRLTKRR